MATATLTRRSSAAAPQISRTLRFGPRTRKLLLVSHIAASGAWLGLDVAMAALVLTIVAGGDPQTRAVAAQALQLVTVWPMLTMALVSLLTGLMLGLGSKYGLVRYWWVLVKLALNLILATLILVALRGGVVDLAEQGRRLAAGTLDVLAVGDMAFPPVVSTSALLVAFVLSVYKPWGRTRRRRNPS